MIPIEILLKQLKDLKRDLNASANRLWSLRISLAEAYRRGMSEEDFLPRRLKHLSRSEDSRFDFLLNRVNGLLTDQLNNPFFALGSENDLRAMLKIKKTVHYIRNAFSNANPVADTLVKLNRALPTL